jgi:hypothetical protein
MKPLSTNTITKIIYSTLSVLFLGLGIYAMTKDYASIALFAGIFYGSFSSKFWYLMKKND